jgi:hypothetical protein
MTGPAFVAACQQPAQPSLFDYVFFGAFAPMPRHVLKRLRPRPLSKQDRALLCEGGRWRAVDLEIAYAVAWSGEG